MNLNDLNEVEVGILLGVTSRTVRRLQKTQGMPSVGVRGARRFCWDEVREWYLLYRVRIARKGGKQDLSLGRLIRKISEDAVRAELQAPKN